MQAEMMILKSLQKTKALNLSRTTLKLPAQLVSSSILRAIPEIAQQIQSVYTTLSSTIPTREEEKVVFPSLHLMVSSRTLSVLKVSRNVHSIVLSFSLSETPEQNLSEDITIGS